MVTLVSMGVFLCCVRVVFFFKQKTAYEVRISDWSSDVCSSDLGGVPRLFLRLAVSGVAADADRRTDRRGCRPRGLGEGATRSAGVPAQIGRASCRARVCQYVSISVVVGSLKTNR